MKDLINTNSTLKTLYSIIIKISNINKAIFISTSITRQIKLSDSPGRTGLAITDKNLHMAERDVYGIIKVYNKQLQHLSTIKHSNMGVVMGISVDIHQNFYVSDYENSCVHVFTKDGAHLRSICHDKEKLKKPCGLCVHGQYVYVTDDTSHCVFMFTTNGEYVTSFGQKGQKEKTS